MVSFSEDAVAAYDLLVNKRHGVESQTMWEAWPGVVKNGEKWNCSAGEETYNPPWAPQLEVAGHRGGLVAGSARQGRLYLAQQWVLVMPPWITNKGKEPLSIQTRRRSRRGQTKKAGVL